MNILTFDVEEWFHILDHGPTREVGRWSGFESRIHRNVDAILALLAKHGQPATFFCLGWIAEKYPEVVRRISETGCEIGTHSYAHRLAYEMSSADFKSDMESSIKILEDVTGRKVESYRAPGFSVTASGGWVFDVLIENGIKNDCSIFPVRRSHGGFPGIGLTSPCRIARAGGTIREFPMNYAEIAGLKLVFSGGGYFRLLPYRVIKALMKNSDYVMTYFHPRDFDDGQPVIKDLSYLRRFKSYCGLRSALGKLDRLLCDFEFVDLKTAVTMLEWEKSQVIKL